MRENVGKIDIMKIIKKMSLIALLLKNSSCPIHSHITMPRTDSTAHVSFVCSEKLQNCWESAVVALHFSKVRETSAFCNSVEKNLTRAWYVPKSGFPRNSRSLHLTEVAGLQ